MIQASSLPDWRSLVFCRVPVEYQGYIRLVCALITGRVEAEKPAREWSPARRTALLDRYRKDLGKPLEDRKLRHIKIEQSGRYSVRIHIRSRATILGTFDSPAAACAAWDDWMRDYLEKETA